MHVQTINPKACFDVTSNVDVSMTCFIDAIVDAGCSEDDLATFMAPFMQTYAVQVYPGVSLDLDGLMARLTLDTEHMCDADSERKTLAVYGDPHVLSYMRRSAYDFQTCDYSGGTESDGSTLFLTGSYLVFSGVNEPICDVLGGANCDSSGAASVLSSVRLLAARV